MPRAVILAVVMLVWSAIILPLPAAGEDRGEGALVVNMLQTPSGVKFGLAGSKPAKPAPTVFAFALTAHESLENEAYSRAAQMLAEHGFLCVSLDLPCHGDDAIPGEPNALAGWRQRIEAGDDLVPAFIAKARAVLDHLISQGYTDPAKVGAYGTSRGGFIALHFAAADARVKCVAAFSPVTDLALLREFDGMRDNPTVKSSAASGIADKLADRWLWICIGNNDTRVATDSAVAFGREVAKSAASKGLPVNVDLHVVKGEPHPQGHLPHAGAHKEAADWILRHLAGTGDG